MLIDRESPVPAFIQIEQDLRRQIMSGRLTDGSRLPREVLLAEKYGASRVTIRRALEELEKADLVQRIHGVGTIVRPPAGQISCDLDFMVSFAEQLTRAGYTPTVEVDRHLVVDALPDEFSGWIDGAQPPFVFLRRIIKVNRRPQVLNRSWIPVAHCPGLEDEPLLDGSLWKTLKARYGILPDRSDSRIEIVRASAEEARLLLCSDDTSLLRVQGLVRNVDGRLVEYCSALWSGNVRLNFSSHRPAARSEAG